MPDDYLSTTETTGAVAVGGSATGEIETSKDFDWFAVDLVAGHTYVIDLEGADSGGGALQDPVLRGLYDVDGNRIAGARDNDGGTGRDARLTFTATTTGTHYIEARGHSNQTGDYTVRVTEWVDTDAERGGAADLGDITAAGPQFPAASLDGSSDSVDYWRFTLSEARRVGLGLRQQDANADLFLEDAEGNVLYSGTEDGTANEWISQTLLAGTYFVRVEAQEEGANEFKLRYGVSAANPDVVAALEQQQQGTDEAPAFAEGSYAFSLAENADGGTTGVALGTVSATDPEDGTVSYSIEAGNSDGLFAIDSETGALSYQGTGEDYESGTTSYELTVRAGDGSLHSDVTVTVNVTNVQEAPEFAEASYAFDLAENADGGAIGVALGAVSATDPENSTITYSIEAGNSGGLFAIDSETGALSYQGAGEDYESGTTSYELTVRANDGGLHSDVTVTVNVTDVQEAPAFGQENYAFSLTENAGGDTIRLSLGRVSAADPEGVAVEYSLVAGNGAGLFEIDAQTGDLFYVGSGEDYESGSTRFELTVRASDGNLFSDATMTIDVTDVPELEPIEQHAVQTVSEPAGVDFSANTSTAGRIAVDDFARGVLDHDGDRDWFAVEFDAGKRYRIDLEGSRTGAGTLGNPYLRGIHDSHGVLIPGTENYADGVGNNSRVAFTAEETGTYYVAAGSAMYYLASRGWVFHEGTYKLSVTEVPDDFAATTQTTGAVAVGGSATGEIEIVGDHDWFAVELDADKTYQIDLKGYDSKDGTLDDPLLRGVYDADGDLIAGTRNDDSGEGTNSRAFFTPQEDGTYYVAARAFEDVEGTYTLSVTDVTDTFSDDYSATTGSTSGLVSVGNSTTGEIDYGYDLDWFRVNLLAGKTYEIDLEGSHSEGGTLRDPFLRGVYDENGVRFSGTIDDDGGDVFLNSHVEFTAQADGTYYVAAGAYGDDTGTYTLSVTEVPDDFEATTQTTGTVEVGGSATGDIEFEGDRDWFAVELDAGSTYRIDLEGSPTWNGTLYNPYLRGVHDANGVLLAGTTDDDGGVGCNSRVTFMAAEDATYYVAAGGYGISQGTYTLSVSVEEVM